MHRKTLTSRQRDLTLLPLRDKNTATWIFNTITGLLQSKIKIKTKTIKFRKKNRILFKDN